MYKLKIKICFYIMSHKRKLDDLIHSFDTMSFNKTPTPEKSTAIILPPAKRGHFLPSNVSKIRFKPMKSVIKVMNYKSKNIFGLDDVPMQDTFTREEVQILIDQRERTLYRLYLQTIAKDDCTDKIIQQLQSVI